METQGRLDPPRALDSVGFALLSAKHGQALVIFDDFICRKDKHTVDTINEYATQARKKGYTCAFLTQNFHQCHPTIRRQVRYVVLLNMGDEKNQNAVIDGLSVNIHRNILRPVIKNAVEHKFNVAIIDMQSNYALNKVLRRNFDQFYKVVDENNEPLTTIKLFKHSGLLN